jgi:hypothetical protein
VVSGSAAVLSVTVSDPGGPVQGAEVTAASGGRSVRGVTGQAGAVRVTTAPGRTSSWTITVTAGGHRPARAVTTVWVVPRVAVRWRGSRVTVTVTPAAGQVVTVWTRGSRGWVRHAHRTAGSAPVTLPVPAAPAARVTVSGALGLSGVTAVRP